MPARLVVLGDSIADCTSASDAECAPYIMASYLSTHGAPGVVLETHAVAGAGVRDLIDQARLVEGGEGHVFVWLYAIGNDLQRGATDPAPLVAGYEAVFDYFGDGNRFPVAPRSSSTRAGHQHSGLTHDAINEKAGGHGSLSAP